MNLLMRGLYNVYIGKYGGKKDSRYNRGVVKTKRQCRATSYCSFC